MSKNSEIAKIFYEIADILEMQNVQWKPRAYRQAAQSIESLKEDVEKLYQKGNIEKLEQIPNIGEALAKKIVEYLKTGKIKEHKKLLKSIPKHTRELMQIPGLGAKKIKKLHDILKISTINQLEKAAREHKIRNLFGFGEKSEKDILEAIELSKISKDRIPLKEAQKEAKKIINQLKKLKNIEKIEAAGSIRRKKPFIRDIDILVSSNNPEKVINAFVKLKNLKKILGKGATKATIILKSGIQADIRVINPKSWGAGLLYFTGNKNYNIMIRKIAIKKGFKLSEYGLFDKKTGKMIAGKTEKEIAKKLNIKLPKPENREI
ncbi:MAG: helix-hairpin-helix domain-containing protein [Candidatus Pacearchaeota archaeon]|nr:helix-hairpin-helix domain-containing protein [Candidatus Pacearchaeota archaeon]